MPDHAPIRPLSSAPSPALPSDAPTGLSSSVPWPTRVRLDYLDGIRALAALYVSFFHATLTGVLPHPGGAFANLGPAGVWGVRLFLSGHFGVSLFIVLSGYCLMLPVARRSGGRMPGGVLAFLGRRARRILPPYYAALGLALGLTALIPGLRETGAPHWAQALPAWRPDVLWSHLFLVQNWSPEWYFKLDPPSWSVATEAQIYLIFAFLLLPLSRWIGTVATALLALGAGFVLHWRYAGLYDQVYWSYIGLFAFGMVGAVINFADSRWARFCRERLPWGAFTLLAWGSICWLLVRPGEVWMHEQVWLIDPLFGVATTCLLIFGTRALTPPLPPRTPLILRFLQARPLVALGGFSYSYYLVHDPVLAVMRLVLKPVPLGYPESVWLLLVLGVLVALLVSYGFHRLFERPFMPGHPTTAQEAARAAVVSPAP